MVRLFGLLLLGYTAGLEQAHQSRRAPVAGAVPDDARVTFVHIPKTGGTSIRRALVEAGCRTMRLPNRAAQHEVTAAFATRDMRRCILVLREPTDRFVSAYWYFVSNEALAIRERTGQGDPKATPRVRHPSFPTVGSLIDAAGARRESILGRTIFAPQSNWADVKDFARTTVVCYDERLSERAASAIRRVTSPPCNVTIPRMNIAARPEAGDLLNETHRAWLRERYARDYSLWEEHCAGYAGLRAREPPDLAT